MYRGVCVCVCDTYVDVETCMFMGVCVDVGVCTKYIYFLGWPTESLEEVISESNEHT